MSRSSRSNHENYVNSAHSWLIEQVYELKRGRTIELVQQSVDALVGKKARISLASIAAISKEIDPEGRGISESAILNNEQARAYYEQHRSWRGQRRKGTGGPVSLSHPERVKRDRHLPSVRQRYLRMGKLALVDRLLAVEQEYAEQQERWLTQQDELLQWRLRAEAAEIRLRQEKHR